MNGFDKVPFQSGAPECTYPYQYTDPSQIAPYWDIAQQYVLAEHMFTTQGSSSFTAHQDLIAGGTIVTSNPPKAMVDLPSCSGTKCVWGCDAPKATQNVVDLAKRPSLPQYRALSVPHLRDAARSARR